MINFIIKTALTLTILISAINIPVISMAQEYDRDAVKFREKQKKIKITIRASLMHSMVNVIEFAEEGNFAVAFEALEQLQATSYSVRHTFAMNQFRAMVYAIQQDFGNAIRLYRTNLNIENIPPKQEYEIVLNLAKLYHMNEDYENAVIFANRWLIFNEKSIFEIHAILGNSYFNLGDTMLAKAHIDHYKSLVPSGGEMFDQATFATIEAGINETPQSGNQLTAKKFWLIDNVSAEYPRSARRSRKDGQVSLLYDVSNKGRAINITVSSSTDPIFEEAAINAVRNLKYILYSVSEDEIYHRNNEYSFDFTYVR